MSTMTVMTPKLVVFTIDVREPIAELYSDAANGNNNKFQGFEPRLLKSGVLSQELFRQKAKSSSRKS
ncbi:hypothetical protein DAPPUDRAFT_322886 [Daphnia pulex]|uniref:Uncharacterized protein n=1 Tax=Daphnia pulex TaxID=6669 RepID=E9GX80_DAPPU|nr:hypothetical protein DAPPUDRAFT_322886 [Daphnia pulex]|eukprot:EFX75906.1 hypothetical protein DAPPUDRAFT_322886 [Daphnia pulex]